MACQHIHLIIVSDKYHLRVPLAYGLRATVAIAYTCARVGTARLHYKTAACAGVSKTEVQHTSCETCPRHALVNNHKLHAARPACARKTWRVASSQQLDTAGHARKGGREKRSCSVSHLNLMLEANINPLSKAITKMRKVEPRFD